MYRSERERQLLTLNLERARALPAGNGRYVIVNPPAARLYMYENGQVVDSMRVVAGRPDPIAQTPMMNAFIRYVALNPYWNSPPDITAKQARADHPQGGARLLQRTGATSFCRTGPTMPACIDPMSIDWHAVAAGRVQVRLRQKPGPANSMGRMKFMFPNAQGIWLHDTPEKEKIDEAARLQSNGCVRLEDAPRFARWLFNGRPPKPQGAKPEQKVNLPAPVPIYITYLTAVPSGTSIVYFDDFYGKDRAAARQDRQPLSSASRCVEVPGPQHRDVVAASRCFGARRPRSNCSPNWTPNLPACAQRTMPRDGPDADDVDRELGPGRDGGRAFDQRAHRRDVAQLHLDRLAVDAGDRAAHQAVARLADALEAVGFDV